MKQILQSFKTGQTQLVEVPIPIVTKGSLLIKTTHSLVSLGTEKMLVEFGKANFIAKAQQQPDKVKMIVNKIKTDGLLPTLENVFRRLEEPMPLGYSNAGIVIEVGEGVLGFSVGDRVASNGRHAEYVCVPQNLVAKIPDNVSQEEAAFTVIGSIGLQGIRLCNPTFGETIVVIGLGLIGLLTTQLLLANGCRVVGIDIDKEKCKKAAKWGVITFNPVDGDNPFKAVMELTNNVGADGVIITASSKSSDIISQAANLSRKRGRIILVGVTGLNLKRAEFYEKELTFQVSCSYGPGRYDENYEHKGIDYPLPFVRWTEKRNLEAVLNAISTGRLNVKELISEIVNLEDFHKIYGAIGRSRSIASILKYPEANQHAFIKNHTLVIKERLFRGSKGIVGVIGAGNFAKMTMLPALKKSTAYLKYISSLDGAECTNLARKYGFNACTTDYNNILHDPEVDTVFIATRHDSHAHLIEESLKAGKHVFVEKPLALNKEQLNQIIDTCNKLNPMPILTVGFNRRFSPHTRAIKKALGYNPGPVNIIATMNAGYIPDNVWVHDLQTGGGRIIGEACHYFDLCVYLTGSEIEAVCMNAKGVNPKENTDNASILLKLKNGSNAVINYFSNGAKSYSKERIEVYSLERVFIIDNFRTTKGFGAKGFRNIKTRINKGHKNQFQEYIDRIKEGGEPLIPLNEIINVTKASFAAIESLQKRSWILINQY